MIRNLLGAAANVGAMLASTAASAQCVAGASSTILYAGQTTPIGTVDFAVV